MENGKLDGNKWIDAFQFTCELYWKWMLVRKCRRKARYHKKLERMTMRWLKHRV